MTTWNRFEDKQPKSYRIVWVLTRRMKTPELRTFTREDDLYSSDRMPGTFCKADDLWCEAEPPTMPTTRKKSIRKPKP